MESQTRVWRGAAFGSLFTLTVAIAASCSNESDPSKVLGTGGGAAGSASMTGGAARGGVLLDLEGGAPSGDGEDGGPPLPLIDDFPILPVFSDGARPNAGDAYQNATESGAGPCVISPEPGTLYPKNWLRPRISVKAKPSHNSFQVTVSTARFLHPLVIYSTKPSVTLDAKLWEGLRNTVVDETILVSVRSAALDASGKVTDGPSAASESSFTIAPVAAPGKIVYWSLPKDDKGAGLIRGFGIGEEGVVDVLKPAQVDARNHQAKCIGCHAATPDGDAVAFSVGPSGYTASIASIAEPTVGAVPPEVSASALETISGLHGVPAFSKAHWSANERTMLLSDTGTLHWVDVGSNQTGELQRTGDERAATVPSWSHDGEHIVYTSAAGLADGRPEHGPMDLRVVPYAAGLGGVSTKLEGASDAAFNEYYPAYSPDDAYVAFSRVPDGQASYDSSAAEVFVVPASGGAAKRLNANDAPACAKQASPGLTNSWPKWSPRAQAFRGKTYYFLTFSSRRLGTPQLFVTTLVDDGHSLTTYPALYLWNQPADEGNHTPDWEEVNIPSVPNGPK